MQHPAPKNSSALASEFSDPPSRGGWYIRVINYRAVAPVMLGEQIAAFRVDLAAEIGIGDDVAPKSHPVGT